jgi:receptor protein-tyrosine kinase
MSIVERALAKATALGKKPLDDEAVGGDRTRNALRSGDVRRSFSQNDHSAPLELDMKVLQAAGLAPPSEMEHLVAEELRVIKRPLLLNAEGASAPVADGKLVMIASALPGAGKTFVSFNIALSMASDLDWTVLLVDADVSRPTLSRCFGLADAPGLIDLLESEHGTLPDYVFRTSHPRLHFLPAGSPRADGKELLGSQRMRTLVADLAEQGQGGHHIVVFDSPPLLLTSEARVLASYAGQIVLVVEAGVTPRQSVLEAIELLDASKAINLILNKNRQLLGIGDYQYSKYEPHGRETR